MHKIVFMSLFALGSMCFVVLAALPLDHPFWHLGKDDLINKRNFYVLMFPRAECSSSIPCVDRAVAASLSELDKLQVQVVDKNTSTLIDLASFSYMPNQSIATTQLIKWREALVNQGYTDGQWIGSCSQYPCEMQLILLDGKHSRKEVFQYVVKAPDVMSPQKYLEITWADSILKMGALATIAMMSLLAAFFAVRASKAFAAASSS